MALAEYNLTREGNYSKKRGQSVPFKKRVEIYRQSYHTYQANKGGIFPRDRGASR